MTIWNWIRFFKSFEIAYMKLLGQNIFGKCLPKIFAKTMYSRNDFPGNSRFRTKVRSHFFRRQYSRNLLCGQKKESRNLQYFLEYPKNWVVDGWSGHLHSGRLDRWTLEAWTVGAWTIGLWRLGHLDTSTLDAWTLGVWNIECLDSGGMDP